MYVRPASTMLITNDRFSWEGDHEMAANHQIHQILFIRKIFEDKTKKKYIYIHMFIHIYSKYIFMYICNNKIFKYICNRKIFIYICNKNIFIWEDLPSLLSHQKFGNFPPSLLPHWGLFNHIWSLLVISSESLDRSES